MTLRGSLHFPLLGPPPRVGGSQGMRRPAPCAGWPCAEPRGPSRGRGGQGCHGLAQQRHARPRRNASFEAACILLNRRRAAAQQTERPWRAASTLVGGELPLATASFSCVFCHVRGPGGASAAPRGPLAQPRLPAAARPGALRAASGPCGPPPAAWAAITGVWRCSSAYPRAGVPCSPLKARLALRSGLPRVREREFCPPLPILYDQK